MALDRPARLTRRFAQTRSRANPLRRRPRVPAPEHPVVNPLELPGGLEARSRGKSLFRMWAGAYRDVIGYVWADSFDSAFEIWVEYLDDNEPHVLTTLDESDLRRAAEDEGIAWRSTWPDWEDPRFERVVQAAEADLTVIGHTTLTHGTHIVSHEWGGEEVTDPGEWDAVYAWSLQQYRDEYGEEP